LQFRLNPWAGNDCYGWETDINGWPVYLKSDTTSPSDYPQPHARSLEQHAMSATGRKQTFRSTEAQLTLHKFVQALAARVLTPNPLGRSILLLGELGGVAMRRPSLLVLPILGILTAISADLSSTPAADARPYGTCGEASYINSRGHCVHRPVRANAAPIGATARCRDGTYSFSESRRGTCSWHGGVATWLRG
jgi:hypothetical protein